MRVFVFSVFIMIAVVKGYSQENISLVPMPAEIKQGSGYFQFDENTYVLSDPSSAQWLVAFSALKQKLKIAAGIDLKNKVNNKGNSISLIQKQGFDKEGYSITVLHKKIVIEASAANGLFYAVQTILQLLPPQIETNKKVSNVIWQIPCLSVKDAPKLRYRGLMLDAARHFMTLPDIKRLLDAMAMHKINMFQWHLTDGAGWRFESKKYPALVERGAFRKGNPLNFTYDYDSKPREDLYGGYYTQDQMKEVVSYAAQKFITVIPEIEMPSHSVAALASYPELLCVDSLGQMRKQFDFGDGSLCTKEETFKFIFDIMDEVMSIFPSEYIHIAGDEAAKQNWNNCLYCRNRMKTEKIKTLDELQSYFVHRVSNYLVKKGRKPIGWDEILEGGLAPNTIVMSWRGEKGGIDAVKLGHQSIMTPGTHCYFDHYLSSDANEPLAWGGLTPLETVYNYKPIPEQLTKEEGKLILGAQANLWTEFIPDFTQASYMIFPRLSALSEVVWSYPEVRDYPDFLKRLKNITDRLRIDGITYSNHWYELSMTSSPNKNGEWLFSVSGLKEQLPVYYTMDGSLPNKNSDIYTKPFTTKTSATITAAILDENGNVRDKVSKTIFVHKGLNAKFHQENPPSKFYRKGGDSSCANGIQGADTRFSDDEWLGWNGRSFIGVYEFDKPTEISSISTRFFHQPKSWIWYPESVSIAVSEDGINYHNINQEKINLPSKDGAIPFTFHFEKQKLKYLKITANPYSIIPAGSVGKGNSPWIFVDEVRID